MKKKIINKIKNAVKKYLLRMQKKWGFNKRDVAIILFVFSVAGFSSLQLRPYIIPYIPTKSGGAIAFTINVIIFTTSYYCLLLILGIIVGKGKFFFFMAKRPLRRLQTIFTIIKKLIRRTGKTLLTVLSAGRL